MIVLYFKDLKDKESIKQNFNVYSLTPPTTLPILPRAGFHSAFISDSLLTAQGGVTDVFLSGGRFSNGGGHRSKQTR